MSVRPGLRRATRTIAAVGLSAAAFGAAALQACAAREAKPAAQAAPSPATSLPGFEVTISRFANLVHVIDNLAGSSQGKTIGAYRGWWADRFGFPGERDTDLLAAWTGLRYKTFARRPPRILNDEGCLPWSEPEPGFRHRFRVRSYEAESIGEFVRSMEGDLTPEEMEKLSEILAAFEPRFDEIWKETTFLARFKTSFEAYLRDSGIRPYLGEVARFFGVDPDAFPPGRIQLMALPADSGTHAQADGRDLLMEIRPDDTPLEQIQVIAHETTHYLWQLVSPARNDAFARQVHGASPRGAVIWRRLRESLPTALGQGLAEARLAPQRFGMHYPWYHTDEVDRLAKSIYPVVEAAFREGRGIEEGVLDEIARAAEATTAVHRAPPGAYLNVVLFAVGDGMLEPYTQIRSRLPMESAWTFSLSNPEGVEFLERYACLTGVVLLSPAESRHLSDLPVALTPPPAPGEAWGGPADGGRQSSIRSSRRAGGGLTFYLTAAREEDVSRIAGVFLELQEIPSGPIFLAPEAPAGR